MVGGALTTKCLTRRGCGRFSKNSRFDSHIGTFFGFFSKFFWEVGNRRSAIARDPARDRRTRVGDAPMVLLSTGQPTTVSYSANSRRPNTCMAFQDSHKRASTVCCGGAGGGRGDNW
jgi:hypothetical protein